MDMSLLLDAVLGTDTSAPPWRTALLEYTAATAKAEAEGSGTGAATAATTDRRLDGLAELKAAAELREAFGDVTEARAVLVRLAEVLDRIDTTETHATAPAGTKTTSRRRPVN